MDIGAPELLLVLLIVVLLFGVGRLTKLGGELGQGIREFRRGLKGEIDSGADKRLEPVREITENEAEDIDKPSDN